MWECQQMLLGWSLIKALQISCECIFGMVWKFVFCGYNDHTSFIVWLFYNSQNTQESAEVYRCVSEGCINVSFVWNGNNEDTHYFDLCQL